MADYTTEHSGSGLCVICDEPHGPNPDWPDGEGGPVCPDCRRYRGAPRMTGFTTGGRVEQRLLVPLLTDPRDPSSWTGWVEPTPEERAQHERAQQDRCARPCSTRHATACLEQGTCADRCPRCDGCRR